MTTKMRTIDEEIVSEVRRDLGAAFGELIEQLKKDGVDTRDPEVRAELHKQVMNIVDEALGDMALAEDAHRYRLMQAQQLIDEYNQGTH